MNLLRLLVIAPRLLYRLVSRRQIPKIIFRTTLVVAAGMLLAVSIQAAKSPEQQASSIRAWTTPRTTPTQAPRTVPAGLPAPTSDAASSVLIARVIDGDTFALADGRRVRVLGIDSCETDTPGGADATTAATAILARGTVTLSAQPGAPDVDRYGRLLRYVQVQGEDFGMQMVGWDHTGVYQGHNDASPEYVRRLYAQDRVHSVLPPPAGRDCGESPPVVDGPDDHYVPVPDGDDDDDDHKSRFCRKHWFC